MKKIKSSSVLVAIMLSLSLAKHRTSDVVVLTAWPRGQHFYLGEPIVLTCEVKRNSSEVWIYNWTIPNNIQASTPSGAHRVNRNTYFISALTSEDSGMYLCQAHNQDTNPALQSNPVYLNVKAASAPATLEVLPDSSQHLQGEEFSLHCSGHSGETEGWTLWRFPGGEINTSYLQMGDRFNLDRNDKYSFNNITAGLSGLYWCETARGDQRSNAVNITVSDGHVIIQTPVRPVTEGQKVTLRCKASHNLNHTFIYKDGRNISDYNLMMASVTKAQEGFYKCINPTAAVESPESWLSVRAEENIFAAAWVWAVCAIVIILLLIPITFLLLPNLRKRVKFFPTCGEFIPHQEMPRTKQDVTEIQWDLAWMEMSNLLEKPRPGS